MDGNRDTEKKQKREGKRLKHNPTLSILVETKRMKH